MAKGPSPRDVIRRVLSQIAAVEEREEADRDAWAERLTRMTGIDYQRGELKREEFRTATAGFDTADARLDLLTDLKAFIQDIDLNL